MFSTYELDARRLPWPADWGQIFGRSAPLLLEIGFGNGQFLARLARQRPEANLLGLDISLPSLRRAASRLRRAGAENVRLLYCDALYGLWALCRPEVLSGTYVNFPDPWPKAAQQHRRLINQRFLHLLASRSRPGALLDIATDHEEYAAVIGEELGRTPYFESRLERPFVTEEPERIRTKYEQIAQEAGRTCYYFKWRRNGEPAGDAFPVPQELLMPHLIFHSPLSLDEIQRRFRPQSWRVGELSGRFVALYRAGHDDVLLVDTYIAEEPLAQRVALMIRPRRESAGEWIAGLHELGFPRPTAGVHRALAQLGDWLQSLDRRVTIVESNLNLS